MIRDGLKVGVFEIQKMIQWGTPYDLEIYRGWSNYFKNIKKGLSESNCPENTTLLLPMAGKGSRFSEVGYELPKPMLPINDNMMVIEAVNCLPKTSNKVFICLNEHVIKHKINQVLHEKYNGCKISKIENVTEGQAITCEIGVNDHKIDLENPIMISACDNGIFYNVDKIQKMLNDENIDIIVWSFRNNQSSKISPNSYAWLDVDENDNIKHVSCKKFIYDDPLKTHAIIGTMFFRKGKYFMDGLEKNKNLNIRTNNEFYVDDVLNQNIKDGLVVKVFEVDNYICWGTPDDYKTYNYWKEYFIN
jgi:NDP-sugar pyrophosphorylase family protein